MALFQLGNFVSHAGKNLSWKIECDSLTDDDWKCIAKLIADRCQFGSVYGIPRGGEKLASYLQEYVTEGPRLVVDDVWTTGMSMLEVMKDGDIGFVVFARGSLRGTNVNALFQLDAWRDM